MVKVMSNVLKNIYDRQKYTLMTFTLKRVQYLSICNDEVEMKYI